MSDRQPRSDRQPCGIYARRGRWYGWYYNLDGKRVNGLPLCESVDGQPAPVPIRVTRPKPDDCPNRFKAFEVIKRLAANPTAVARPSVSLLEAIDQWETHLRIQGCTPRYVHHRAEKLRATVNGVTSPGPADRSGAKQLLVVGTSWRTWGDITRRSFRGFLERLTEAGRAPSTRNYYLDAWKDFLAWAVEDELLAVSPLATMSRAKGTGRCYVRRPFMRQEFQVLLDNVDPETRLFYAVQGLAGLRYSEALNLKKEDLDPTADPPVWKLPPDLQKVQRPETLPMMPMLAHMLAQRWYLLKEGQRFFQRSWRMENLRADCRKAHIPLLSARKEHIAFHSFRYFFATEMAKIMPMRRVQELMRHRSITLTMTLYAKLHLKDVGEMFTVPNLY